MQNVLIAGGTGLIGSRLTELLSQKNYSVSYLSRNKIPVINVSVYRWDPFEGTIENGAIENADHIINLAGVGIGDKAWTNNRRHQIISSRVNAARTINNALKRSDHHVKSITCASAIGYYKKNSNELLTEISESGTDFLSYTTQQWEAASRQFESTGIRTTIFRIGIVLSLKGGALAEMYKPLKFFIAPYFRNGKQIYSWIHIDDLCHMFIKSIEDEKINGVYNAVAPNPVSNKIFMKALVKTKAGYSFLMPVPAILMKLFLGERATVVLDGQFVSCQKIMETGFEFQFPELNEALKNCVLV